MFKLNTLTKRHFCRQFGCLDFQQNIDLEIMKWCPVTKNLPRSEENFELLRRIKVCVFVYVFENHVFFDIIVKFYNSIINKLRPWNLTGKDFFVCAKTSLATHFMDHFNQHNMKNDGKYDGKIFLIWYSQYAVVDELNARAAVYINETI